MSSEICIIIMHAASVLSQSFFSARSSATLIFLAGRCWLFCCMILVEKLCVSCKSRQSSTLENELFCSRFASLQPRKDRPRVLVFSDSVHKNALVIRYPKNNCGSSSYVFTCSRGPANTNSRNEACSMHGRTRSTEQDNISKNLSVLVQVSQYILLSRWKDRLTIAARRCFYKDRRRCS